MDSPPPPSPSSASKTSTRSPASAKTPSPSTPPEPNPQHPEGFLGDLGVLCAKQCFLFVDRVPKRRSSRTDPILGSLSSANLSAKPLGATACPRRASGGCTIVDSRGNCPESDVVTPDRG